MYSNKDFLKSDNNNIFTLIVILSFFIIFLLLSYLHIEAILSEENRRTGEVLSDFIAFWTASKMALSGQASDIYDAAKFAIAEGKAVSPNLAFLPWHNPPIFLLVIIPFCLFGLTVSMVSWYAVTCLAYIWVIWKILPNRYSFIYAFIFPAFLHSTLHGQTGTYLVACFAGGLLLLDQKKIVFSALVFSLIAIKPHFGFLLPIAFIASKEWKLFFYTGFFVLLLCLLSVFFFGWKPWMEFIQGAIDNTIPMITDEKYSFLRLQSIFGLGIWLELSAQNSLYLQLISSIFSICLVYYVWRNEAISFQLKCSTLIIGTLLFSGYVMAHDLLLLVICSLFLVANENITNFGKKVNIGVAFIILLLNSPIGEFFPPNIVSSSLILIAIYCNIYIFKKALDHQG